MAKLELAVRTWAVTVRFHDGGKDDYTVQATTMREAARIALRRWHRESQHLITQLVVASDDPITVTCGGNRS